MKKQILSITTVFLIILVILTFTYFILWRSVKPETQKGEQLVLINEISQTIQKENPDSKVLLPMEELDYLIRYNTKSDDILSPGLWILLFALVTISYVVIIMIYIFVKILGPFHRMEIYAEQIAGGNLDIPLRYEKINFFGSFTWAFDHMREELSYAKKREKEAIEENKSIIATLSHDIKTPIASIRAYSECLDANMNASYEKRQQYTEVILRKCDEVSALVNDLVVHSLSELDKLEIHCEQLEIDNILEQVLKDFEYVDMEYSLPFIKAKISGDSKRIAQVIENLLNNARKYAKGTKCEISTKVDEDNRYQIHIRDHGSGICPEDMPFITDRFYRGQNVGDQPGSGLGLYIVKYIMEAMKGGLTLQNEEDGLNVCIWFPIQIS